MNDLGTAKLKSGRVKAAKTRFKNTFDAYDTRADMGPL